MNEAFRKRVIDDYKSNFNWQKIVIMMNTENGVKLSFFRKNDLIFRTNDFIIEFHAYESRRLCISHSMIKDILKMIHDESHDDFARYYEKISTFYYIRKLIRYFREYFKHCPKCQIFQTRRHLSYEFMQSILISSVSFHIITIDFIFILSFTINNYNCLMSIICKYFKRIFLIFENTKWFAEQWDKALLHQLNVADWRLSKIIIFDKNKKFFFELWIVIFKRLDVSLFYSTTYHSQIDEQSEKINQMIEIVLKYYMNILQKSFKWKSILGQIQRKFNNFTSVTIEKFFNEVVYDFTSLQIIDLLKSSANLNKNLQSHVVIAISSLPVAKFFFKKQIRQNVANFIAFV